MPTGGSPRCGVVVFLGSTYSSHEFSDQTKSNLETNDLLNLLKRIAYWHRVPKICVLLEYNIINIIIIIVNYKKNVIVIKRNGF